MSHNLIKEEERFIFHATCTASSPGRLGTSKSCWHTVKGDPRFSEAPQMQTEGIHCFMSPSKPERNMFVK